MKTILIDGHLGRDAEIRTTATGKKYVSFTFANNSRVKNVDKTTWYDVTCFDPNTVENRLEYLKKGKYLFITGRYDTKAYVEKDGSLKVSESILADRIDFINTGGRSNGESNTQAPAEATTGVMTPDDEPEIQAPTPVYQESTHGSASVSDGDEELPF